MTRKIITIILCLFMIGGSIIPQNSNKVYAYNNTYEEQETKEVIDNGSVNIDTKDVPLVEEIETLRTENEKHFRKLDGSYEVVVYDVTVHYWDGTKWKDIDNSFSDEKSTDTISTKENKFKIYFPNKIDDNKSIKLKMDSYSIEWSITNIETSNAVKSDGSSKQSIKLSELNNIESSVVYEEIQKGVSLEYIVSGTSVKENIILDQYIEDFSLTFEYKLKNLKIKQYENGQILFVNNLGEEIFNFSDMVMFDKGDDFSDEITFSVKDNGKGNYTITIKPDNSWLENAKYPVKIDPTINSTDTRISIYDTYVYQAYPTTVYSSSSKMYVGMNPSFQEYRGLIYFNMPSFVMDKVITYSYMSLAKSSPMTNGMQINLYKNTSTFSSNSTYWNNKPNYDPNVVDYYTVNSDTPAIFDITESVKEWQAAGQTRTTGFTLKQDDYMPSYSAFYQNYYTAGDTKNPVITIGYEEPAGLKDYWTYTSQDLGMVGTGYISDYTGNLTWVRNEYNLDNEYMNLSLSLFYNNYSRSVDIGYGKGWKTNYNMQVLKDSNTNSYYLSKPDGNKIYFVNETGVEVYQGCFEYTSMAEDGSLMILRRNTTYGSDSSYSITTSNDLVYYFNSSGRLYRVKNDKTQHKIDITYIDSTSQKIDYITDEVGNKIILNYAGDLLSYSELQLVQTGGILRGVEKRNYHYDQYDNLDYINYSFRYGTDNTNWSYQTNDIMNYYFDSDHKFINAYNMQDQYKLTYSYNTSKQVDNILVTDNGFRLGDTDIIYEVGRTKYIDYKSNSVYYSFDNYGHTINIMDDFGNSTYYKYSGLFYFTDHTMISNVFSFYKYDAANMYPNYYCNHSLLQSSDVLKQQQNPVDNHSFEENDIGWNIYDGGSGSVEMTNEDSMLGDQSIAITHTSSTEYAYQNVYLEAGNYTLSAWIKNPGTTIGAYVDIISEDSNTGINRIHSSNEWQKYTISFTLNTDKTIIIKLLNYSVSTAYFDNIQISEGFIDSRYNAVLNNSFEEGTSSWTMSGASVVNNTETGIMKEILGEKVLQINGDGSTQSYCQQELTSINNLGATYMIGGWAKADAVPNKGYLDSAGTSLLTDNRFFGIKLHIKAADDQGHPLEMVYYLPFDSSIEDWQYQMFSFTLPISTYEVQAYFVYQGEGTAYFDNLQFYHDDVTTKYSYDIEDGNIVLVQDPSGKETEIEYDLNGDISSVTANDITTNIDRNSSYMIEEVETNNVRTTFEYDILSKQLVATYVGYDKDSSTQDKWFKTSTSYTSDGQYIDLITNEFGDSTSIETNSETGLVEEIIDALGNSQSFVYDQYGNLISTTLTDNDTNDTIVGSYSYDDLGRLDIIYRDGFYYQFVYNNLSQLEFVKVINGSDSNDFTELMKYDYYEEIVGSTTYYTNLLKKQTYGNGDYINFTYTDEDQIKTVSLNGNIRYEYDYDSSGRLCILKDIHNNNIYFYTYDLSGRLIKITDKDSNNISYEYDSKGNLDRVEYNIDSISKSIRYYYDSTTGQYDYTIYNAGSVPVKNEYFYDNDSLKRLDEIRLTIGSVYFTKSFDYSSADSSMGNATTRVYQVNYKKGTNLEYFYRYYYDENQNITRVIVFENNIISEQYDYSYDGFNQLITEKIKLVDENYERSYKYLYDDYGNITSIREYNYNMTTLLKTTALTYDSIWTDRLINKKVVEGTTIEDTTYQYDDSGNPTLFTNNLTSYGNKTYTWEGRQLIEIETYGDGLTFKYNSQGLRTQKFYDGYSSDYTVDYVLDGDKIIVEYRGNDVIYYTYDVDGSLLSMNYNGSEYFYITDLLGNVIEMVDTNGNTVVEYKYDAWGNIIYQTPNSSIGDINPFRYRSYYLDTETGYYYLQSRYYNPEIGRFINGDGLLGEEGNVLSHNVYAYCANNPVMYSDISGYAPEWLESIGEWFNNHWKEIVIGTAFIIVGALITAATCGVGTTFWAAFGSAMLTSSIQVGVGMAAAVGVNGLKNLSNGNAFFDDVGNTLASSYIWGGILSGGAQILSGTFRIGFAKFGYKGINTNSVGFLSPDKLYYNRSGMTIFRFGSRTGGKLALDFGRYSIHAHIGSSAHIWVIPEVVSAIEYFRN